MKQILLMIALVGCGKNNPELRSENGVTPNEAANELLKPMNITLIEVRHNVSGWAREAG